MISSSHDLINCGTDFGINISISAKYFWLEIFLLFWKHLFPADLGILGGGDEGAGRGRGELHLLHVALLVAVEEVLEARRPAQRAQRAARRAPQRHGHVPRLEPENRNTQDVAERRWNNHRDRAADKAVCWKDTWGDHYVAWNAGRAGRCDEMGE